MKRETESAIILVVLTIVFVAAFKTQSVRADGSIYIRLDGSVDPATARISSLDNVTYVLDDSVLSSIVIEKDNVVLDGKGFRIEGPGAYDTIGIYLNARTNVTIKNVEVTEFWQGFKIVASSNIRLHGNNVTYHYDGIVMISSSNTTISENNVVANYDDGIWLDECSGNDIYGNQIVGSELTNHDYGITLQHSSNNVITQNNVANTEYGIGFQYSSNNQVSKSSVAATSQYAVWFLSSSDNTMRENNITSNYGGIWFAGSSNNLICRNNFVNNTVQVKTENAKNTWGDGDMTGGNYWSDYAGKDGNSDGIGDVPYFINEDNQDQHPSVVAIPEFRSTTIVPTLVIMALITAVVHRRKQTRRLPK